MTLCFLATLSTSDRVRPQEFSAMGYYGMAAHRTVPEYRDTVSRLDREEGEISNALETYFTEKTHPKENGLALQQQLARHNLSLR